MGHMTIGDRSFRCLNCGDEYNFEPMSVNMLIGLMKGFDADHARCKPSDRGLAKMNAKNVIDWRKGFDTGTSSITIWNFFMGQGGTRADVPYDPADFGRCWRLLSLAPEWRADLYRLGKSLPFWKPFTDAWAELEALWDEETKRDDECAPKLYERMSELVKQSHDIRYAEAP